MDPAAENDSRAARDYHERTKHSLESVQSSAHRLDWSIQPRPFKVYRDDLPSVALPTRLAASSVTAFDAIARTADDPSKVSVPSLAVLARLLHLSAGITKVREHAGGVRIYFRAAACTGALYHIELHVICGHLPDLAAGVYHFAVHEFALRRLRAGDFRATVAEAAGREPATLEAPVILALTSTYWRNAWKYQARAYRHAYWDAGTILANLLAAAAAESLPARVITGFADRTVNRLLAVDDRREATVALVALGRGEVVVGEARPVEEIDAPTVPVSSREVDYPAIREMHAASSLATPEAVAAWRGRASKNGSAGSDARPGSQRGESTASARQEATRLPLALPAGTARAAVGSRSLDDTIRRRGSSREFAREPIALEPFAAMLDAARAPVALDVVPADGPPLTEPFLIVHAVDGLAAGSYRLRSDGLELLRAGDFRREAGFLGLGQALPADASADVYFLCDLDVVLDRFGARGYRAAQLEAAIRGGFVYLAAYAVGLGATGLTFFDDDVTRFFSPDAEGRAVMFLVAVGKPLRARRAP